MTKNNEMKDNYATLGIRETASMREVKKAYRRLAFQYHPDHNKEDNEQATRKFKEITEAYEAISGGYGKKKLAEPKSRPGVEIEALVSELRTRQNLEEMMINAENRELMFRGTVMLAMEATGCYGALKSYEGKDYLGGSGCLAMALVFGAINGKYISSIFRKRKKHKQNRDEFARLISQIELPKPSPCYHQNSLKTA